MAREEVTWLSTKEAARRLGITTRTLYRLIDTGQLTAYKFTRVIRLKEQDVDDFIEQARIRPGELEHLYADGSGDASEDEDVADTYDDVADTHDAPQGSGRRPAS